MLHRLNSIPVNLFNRLQSVLNAAARSVAGLRRSDHITDTLASSHWLRAPEHIKFKLAVIVYRGVHGTAPRYLSHLLRRVKRALLPVAVAVAPWILRCMRQTSDRRQTDVRQKHYLMPPPIRGGGIITKFFRLWSFTVKLVAALCSWPISDDDAVVHTSEDFSVSPSILHLA